MVPTLTENCRFSVQVLHSHVLRVEMKLTLEP